jgi:hypothetical protein
MVELLRTGVPVPVLVELPEFLWNSELREFQNSREFAREFEIFEGVETNSWQHLKTDAQRCRRCSARRRR